MESKSTRNCCDMLREDVGHLSCRVRACQQTRKLNKAEKKMEQTHGEADMVQKEDRRENGSKVR